MGGTLDLSTFYLPLHHLSPCTFNAALDLRTYVSLEVYDPGKIKISSQGFEDLTVIADTASYDHPLGLMLAVAAHFNAQGVHIRIRSTSPPRSALGGSSVAAVALIWAFSKVLAKTGRPMPEPSTVAAVAHGIEQSVAGIVCGMQDQLAAVYGGVNGWYWADSENHLDYRRKKLVPNEKADLFSQSILVAYCGEPHESQDINGTWVRGFLRGQHRDVWRQIVDCSHNFIRAIAQLDFELAMSYMDRELDLRLQLTPAVIDSIGNKFVQAARQKGCSARFTGAGGGGCLWALGTPDCIRQLKPLWQSIAEQKEQAKILETNIDTQGVL
ncbi:MAG: galactokinase [Desulfobacteraceae bacterium]|nr:galactokinase [Desulfobacteraceae bacterium]